MLVKVRELAVKLGLTSKNLRQKSAELGFEIKSTEKEIEEDLAELLEEELKPIEEKISQKAEIYEEMIQKELERERIKAQRKKTAGKEKGVIDKPKQEEKIEIKKDKIEIPEVITVKGLAEKTGLSAAKIIGELMKNGILANINQQIDFETALLVAENLGLKLVKKRGEAKIEDILSGNLEKLLKEEDESVLSPRSPVVSVMGHVDHGKTRLLDTIRHTHVIDTEAGGITQHIGAYQVTVSSEKRELNGKKITFLDTPGHEAFTAMRARGAKATDIAILVVAADEGVKPQTVEAINHAKEAGIPIIVALNKVDKKEANVDRVKKELAEIGLQPEDWGGKTIMVPISALTGKGINALLEMVLLVAEMEELKANSKRPAVGTVIEAHLDPNLGPVATILINTGTLKISDNVIVGGTYGRIKSMKDALENKLKSLGPSEVAQIAGLATTPFVGDLLQVVKNEKIARTQAAEIKVLFQTEEIKKRGLGMGDILSQIHEGQLKVLKIVLKTDTKGSLEAITQALAPIKSPEVSFKIIHSGVGNITESDVMMASASKGLVVGFHTKVSPQVQKVAERENVEILVYKIIYELTSDLKKILSGLLEPEIITTELGKAEVVKIFFTGKKEMVAGCKIIEGRIENKAKLKVKRGDEEIGQGLVANLKLVNEDVREVEKGNECGIRFEGNLKLEEGDILEAFKEEKKIKTL